MQPSMEPGEMIDRSTVYGLCGFDRERTLNRLTMPATGVAREMMEDGDRPEGLDDAVWALGFGVAQWVVDFFPQ